MLGKYTYTAAALLSAGALVLIGSFQWLLRDRSLDLLREKGEIHIGYAVEPPFAFVDCAQTVTGESPELAKRVVERLGIRRIRWKQMEFGALFDRLASGGIDVIAAGVFITPERARFVSFSRPTAAVKHGLLVAPGNPLDLRSYQDLNIRNARVAVLGGSVEESALVQLELAHERIVRVPDAGSGQQAVESGYADAFAISAATLRWWQANGRLRNAEIVAPLGDSGQPADAVAGYAAFAFRPEDIQLRAAWDRELGNILGSEEHRSLAARFGFDADALLVDMTAEQALASQ